MHQIVEKTKVRSLKNKSLPTCAFEATDEGNTRDNGDAVSTYILTNDIKL